MSKHSSSKAYELLVRPIVAQKMSSITGIEDLEVLHGVKMKGLSGFEHTMDVVYKFKLWQTEILVVVECKQYNHKVGVDELLEFRARIEDIRAHKGVFVTPEGFQSGAIEFAKGNRIALLLAKGTRVLNVCYSLREMSFDERLNSQAFQLRREFSGLSAQNLERISIDPLKRKVRISYDNATVNVFLVN